MNIAQSSKILLVDDDLQILAGLTRVLKRDGYPILTASSAEEAIPIVVAEKPAVVISDECMPGMRGRDLLVLLKKTAPYSIRIMLTGCTDLGIAMDAINEGSVFRYFTKPCDELELRAAIRAGLLERTRLMGIRETLPKMKEGEVRLSELAALCPGLTEVDRDRSGTILLKESGQSLDAVVAEIEKQIEEQERKIGLDYKSWKEEP